ncbi:class I SAM-dependent methyltransferase [Asanoa siamensis]|uniref:Methyltransferase n=1 Tax=Asanoa siamensis TaxID=926357 RepID=A0ABQ4CSS2_9ACTN|nr:class I SAM-dependent methyltransferase [Asanoa siamensis]GIF74330.1 methyltransferase [Asanoa siamensis]
MPDWEWDETLYAGSAVHYPVGRVAYPPALATAIRDALGLDGTGRLLDVGCGPGSLTLLLAPLFAAAVGVDADPGMLAEAGRRDPGATVHWRAMRAEDLPGGLGRFRVVTFAQSFHWMDQPRVARSIRPMVDQAWVHVFAQTHRGLPDTDGLPHPPPPWDGIDELVRGYLGPVQRAGQGFLRNGTKDGEEDVMRATGFQGPTRITAVPARVVTRTTDEVVAAVLSLSGSAPHLFGDRLPAFVDDLRKLLGDGPFAERLREIEIVIWRP